VADPVISNVTVVYPGTQTSALPGDQVRITVDATDADNYTVSGHVTVTDAKGGSASATFAVVVADALTYTATADQGTISQDPAHPNEFVLTVPD